METQSVGQTFSSQPDNLLQQAINNAAGQLVSQADNKHQSHGLTVGDMKNLAIKQSLGTVKKVKANQDDKYEIDEHEQHLIHITLETPRFNEVTGERLSKPHVRCFYVNDFEKMSRTVKDKTKKNDFPENAFRGSLVRIIHDPRDTKSTKTALSKSEPTLDLMNESQLRAKYFELTKEDSDPADTPDMIRYLINEFLSKANPNTK